MNDLPEPDWRQTCEQMGLDPQELRKVSSRYDMYQTYTVDKTGECLPLERWYKWYRIEKLSEGHAARTPPADGCSIGPDTAASEPVISERDFLQLLQMYRGE